METTYSSFYIFGKSGEKMEINVGLLQKEYINLSKQLETFYDSYLNIYNDLKEANSAWQDYHARLFFNSVNNTKIKVNNTYDELSSLKDIYLYLINQYKSLGNKIKIDLKAKDEIIFNFNNFNDKLNELISLYNSLDLSFCPNEAVKLNKQKEELIKIKSYIIKSKEKVKDVFNKVETIENEVNLKLSKIDIESLKEITINEFI